MGKNFCPAKYRSSANRKRFLSSHISTIHPTHHSLPRYAKRFYDVGKQAASRRFGNCPFILLYNSDIFYLYLLLYNFYCFYAASTRYASGRYLLIQVKTPHSSMRNVLFSCRNGKTVESRPLVVLLNHHLHLAELQTMRRLFSQSSFCPHLLFGWIASPSS